MGPYKKQHYHGRMQHPAFLCVLNIRIKTGYWS
jgi:hypothetical protein